MTTTLDLVLAVVEHAKRWRIDGRIIAFSATASTLSIVVPNGDVALLHDWARHLDAETRTICALHGENAPGRIDVHGQIMSGHRVTVTVWVEPKQLAGRGTRLELGELEQLARPKDGPVPCACGALCDLAEMWATPSGGVECTDCHAGRTILAAGLR